MKKRYRFRRGNVLGRPGWIVEREHDDGWHALSPGPSQRLFNHSPDGFSWGYGGSGPAQLALALLLDGGLPDGIAVRLHQGFKDEFVAPMPGAGGDLEIDAVEWAIRTAHLLGLEEGITRYAYTSSESWAENGAHYVGTTGKKLADALREAREEQAERRAVGLAL